MSFGKNERRQSGMALASALMVLVILAIIAGCFAQVMCRDASQAQNMGLSLVAQNAAEAGIDYAVWLHRHNMALFPVVNYNSEDDKLLLAHQKQSSSVPDKGYFLPQGAIYNLSGALLRPKFEPLLDKLGNSEVVNKIDDNHILDTEYMFVNELSFNRHDNFMRSSMTDNASARYCVTFQIRESMAYTYPTTLSDSKNLVATLQLASTGKVREIPNNYNWDSDDKWLEFFESVGSESVGGVASKSIESKRLDAMGFREVASRTVLTDMRFGFDSPKSVYQTRTRANAPAYPSQVQLYNDADLLPLTRQHQMLERNKREWFR